MIPDATCLQSDEEVEAFLAVTASKPIRLQVVLHRDPNQVPPIPDTSRSSDGAYFAIDFLDAAEAYQCPAEDSDVLQRNLGGMVNRTFHKTDAGFEDLKLKIRKGIRRQQRALRTMKNKQPVKFPNANAHNSDDDKLSWMDDLDATPQNGQKVVFARGVTQAAIAACDADLANYVATYTAA